MKTRPYLKILDYLEAGFSQLQKLTAISKSSISKSFWIVVTTIGPPLRHKVHLPVINP